VSESEQKAERSEKRMMSCRKRTAKAKINEKRQKRQEKHDKVALKLGKRAIPYQTQPKSKKP